MECYRCGQFGHMKDDCYAEQCGNCGKFGHVADICYVKYCSNCNKRGHSTEKCHACIKCKGSWHNADECPN